MILRYLSDVDASSCEDLMAWAHNITLVCKFLEAPVLMHRHSKLFSCKKKILYLQNLQ